MLKQLLKFIIPDRLKRSVKEQLGVPGLHHTLMLLKQRGYQPNFVIDGGAYEGKWTLDFLEVFPDARILMLEAQESKAPLLGKLVGQHPKVQLHQGVLGAEEGRKVVFNVNETASHVAGIASENEQGVGTETIDAILKRLSLPYPDFIKLDVQGYELEVLKGAEECMRQAEFCLLEVSLLDLSNEPLISEVLFFMNEKGFQAYDICQLMRRPYDQSLYQIDLLFINKKSGLIAVKRWD